MNENSLYAELKQKLGGETPEKVLLELNSLKKTIHETEDGYNKITEAGKTLMAIVSQNLPKIQKIETTAETITEIPNE